MPNQFFNKDEGDLENYFVSEYWLIDQYVGDTLWAWGFNTFGKLGDNTITSKTTPVTTFAGGTNWKQVTRGQNHTAAIKTDGTLWTWGRNDGFGSYLGDNTVTNRSIPVTTFAGGTNWKQVAGGQFHTAAIKTDGTLWTWGVDGGFGNLGDNTANSRVTPITTFAGGTNWKQVSGGFRFTAAIKTDGTLWTWGSNSYGVIGNNTTTQRNTPVTTFAGGTNWKQVACFLNNVAAIKTDGTLWTWGSNNNGQLGDNTTTQRNTPVTTFAGGSNWKQVACGYYYTAAIKTDGTLWTWGSNSYGLLGNNDLYFSQSLIPISPVPDTNWKQIDETDPLEVPLPTLACNYYTGIAIKTDGTLWTWGQNNNSQLGDNTTTQRNTPVTTFAGGTDWKQVSSGYRHKAAIKTDGTLWTWGNNYSKLGDNTSTSKTTPVTTFAGGTNWKQVACGQNHVAAIKTDGTLWTWGQNINGELGDNTTGNLKYTPVTTFAGGTNWKQVSSGYHTAAIKTDGTLWTWGSNNNGQLGNNTTTQRNTPVTTFAGGSNWKQVDCGVRHTAAIKTDGTLWTWGWNIFAQLGNNTTTQINTPITTFVGGANWKQVSCGILHTAAIKTDGTLWTWGSNISGELGDNTTIGRSTPVTTFAGGTNWKQVDCGDLTAAIKTDGTIWTWGSNQYGQLLVPTLRTRSTPITTFAGGTNWKQVDCGYHTAAIKTDGTLWTWGFNSNGMLGDNTTISRSTPVTTFAGGTNWKQVSAKSGSTLAITSGTDPTLFIS